MGPRVWLHRPNGCAFLDHNLVWVCLRQCVPDLFEATRQYVHNNTIVDHVGTPVRVSPSDVPRISTIWWVRSSR